jgi:GH25 family lysozyme M1 (1,4-beta-N-acetylmuramidase)
MTLGVDLYRYQTVTDFAAMAGAAHFAWVKLTDGTGPAQVRGDRQVNGCKAARIPVGGYHYAQPGNPEQQATVLLRECSRLGAFDLAPALDLEAPFTPGPSTRDFGERFCQAVAAAGYRPAVYMSASWAGAMRPDQWDVPGLVIWLAAYGTNDGRRRPTDVTRHYGGRCDVHQFTSNGVLPGVSGRVDLNEATADIRNSPQRKDENVKNLILAEAAKPLPGETALRTYVGDGLTRRHVADERELEGLQYWIEQKGGNPAVQRGWEDLRVLGEEVSEAAPVELGAAQLDALADKVAARLRTLEFKAQA